MQGLCRAIRALIHPNICTPYDVRAFPSGKRYLGSPAEQAAYLGGRRSINVGYKT
jgi:hypothetical protein